MWICNTFCSLTPLPLSHPIFPFLTLFPTFPPPSFSSILRPLGLFRMLKKFSPRGLLFSPLEVSFTWKQLSSPFFFAKSPPGVPLGILHFLSFHVVPPFNLGSSGFSWQSESPFARNSHRDGRPFRFCYSSRPVLRYDYIHGTTNDFSFPPLFHFSRKCLIQNAFSTYNPCHLPRYNTYLRVAFLSPPLFLKTTLGF